MDGNQEFGEFLRSRRARLRPEDVGIVSKRRRRAQGLRREEVASRAGISAEWYVKLEQGRAVSPSEQTVGALAKALRLSKVEESHLRSLARAGQRTSFVRESVPDGLRRVVEGLSEPAYLTGQRWDVLAWNAAAADLLGDFARVPVEDRNILVFMFARPASRKVFGTTWNAEARRMVSLFRTTYDLWSGDIAFTSLIERLSTASKEFATWWADHDVAVPVSGEKILKHPTRGLLHLEYATFQANDDPHLKLAIYTEKTRLPARKPAKKA